MKILHIITSLEVGGAEKLLVNVASLQAQKHEVTVIYFKVHKLAGEFDKKVNVLHIPIGVGVVSAIKKEIEKIQPDVVHTHLTHADLFGLIAAKGIKKRKFKTVSTIHSTIYRNNPFINKQYYNLYKLLYNSISPRTEVIAISKALQNHIHSTFKVPMERIKLLYNTVPMVKKSDMEEPASIEKYKDKFKILFVGRLTPVKSIDTLIKAVALLPYTIKQQVVVYIVGTGVLEDELKDLTQKMGLEDTILFEGMCKSADPYFRNANTFVLCSLSEGLPIVILEALKYGNPLITTRLAGPMELIEHEHNGLICNIGEPEGLAESIVRLYEDEKLRTTLSENAKDFYNKNLKPEVYIESLDKIYRS